jgi:cobalt/nickel transport system permease protein
MRRPRALAALAIVVCLLLAAGVSRVASSSPDGLTKVAQRHGFAGAAHRATVQRHAPAGGYAFPGVRDGGAARSLAGLAGTLTVLAAGTGLGVVIVRRRRRAPTAG